MKKLSLFFTFYFYCSIAFCQVNSNHALIFVIGSYPSENGWDEISGVNDLPLIKTSIINRGFLEENIHGYSNEQVTKKGIFDAFSSLINNVSVKKGDVVYIHFSCHGSQLADLNGDETDDNLDEAIVTYNSINPRKNKVYSGKSLSASDFYNIRQEYLLDDELDSLLTILRYKLGSDGDLLVTLDACHSGSGTRGYAKIRGGEPAIIPTGFTPKSSSINDKLYSDKNYGELNMSPYVVISGARSYELNYETDLNNKSFGSLSLALSKTLENTSKSNNISYRTFFAGIIKYMDNIVPQQHPVLEGNGIDRELFGGKYLKQQPYILISSITGNDINLKAGRIFGLTVGSKLLIHESGTLTADSTKAIATATVISVDNFTSVAKLNKPLKDKKSINYLCFIAEFCYKIEPLNIHIITSKSRGDNNKSFSEIEAKAIRTSLSKLPYIKFNEFGDGLTIIHGVLKDTIKVSGTGYVFALFDPLKHKTSFYDTIVSEYSKWKYLKALDFEDPNSTLKVYLIPIKNKKLEPSLLESKMKAGYVGCNKGELCGDTIAICIKNTTGFTLYYNILDLQPDGKINCVIPKTNRADPIYPMDCRINAGDSITLLRKLIWLSPPYGREEFKIFVSTSMIDLEGLQTNDAVRPRGIYTEIEGLVKKSTSMSRGDNDAGSFSSGNGSIIKIPFDIIEQK